MWNRSDITLYVCWIITKNILSDSKAFLKEEVLITWEILKSIIKDYDFNIWSRSG